MNVSFVMYKKSVILCDNRLEIYHDGEIKTQLDWDTVNFAVMNFIHIEGFLDDHSHAIEFVNIFDCHGNQVIREKCQEK